MLMQTNIGHDLIDRTGKYLNTNKRVLFSGITYKMSMRKEEEEEKASQTD
jgi:hypothetical protein